MKYVAIIVVLVVVGLAVYRIKLNSSGQQARTGTETLTAEEVVDLEVQAQQQFEAAGGKY